MSDFFDHRVGFAAGVGAFVWMQWRPNLPAFAYACATSEDVAITYPRGIMTNFAKTVFLLCGCAELAALPREYPALFRELFGSFPWLEKLPTFSTVSYRRLFLSVPLLLTMYRLGAFLLLCWNNNLTPVPIEPFEKAPFTTTQVTLQGKAPDTTDATFAKDMLNRRWVPKGLNITYAMRRSASYYGMQLGAYLYNQATIGVEYPLNIFFRVFLRYAHIGRFSPKRRTTRCDMYQAMVNTCMISWMDFETGHLRFENLRLPFQDTSVININYVTIDLDHDKQEFLGMTLLMDDGLGEHRVVGPEDDDIEEAVVIANTIASLYAHFHIHWWANGTAQLINPTDPADRWDLAQESNDITQWMNNAASYGSYGGIGVGSAAVMADILSHNGAQGLPIHHCARPTGQSHADHEAANKFIHLAARNSTAHNIIMASRVIIKKLRPGWTPEVTNAFLASTVMHSSDHYYIDKFTSFSFKSKVMRHDISYLRLAFFGPNTYFTRSIKCKENLHDDLCEALFQVAHEIDPGFADKLFIGCAN